MVVWTEKDLGNISFKGVLMKNSFMVAGDNSATVSVTE